MYRESTFVISLGLLLITASLTQVGLPSQASNAPHKFRLAGFPARPSFLPGASQPIPHLKHSIPCPPQSPSTQIVRQPSHPASAALFHTVALVACSNPSALRLGIDIQTIVTVEQSADIQPLVATDGELAIMMATGLSREMAVTAIFSAKEALYKAIFPLVDDVLEFDVVTLIQHSDSLLHFATAPSLQAYGIKPYLHCHLEIQDEHVQCFTWQA